ncbi:MAG: NADH-quinone oxidoreductase subunit N [Candidatus Micrarchaeota archaeon]|nr:NADH-quinone oxidoreductase subunit N [Candidatus Micrarchaeota archaeon]
MIDISILSIIPRFWVFALLCAMLVFFNIISIITRGVGRQFWLTALFLILIAITTAVMIILGESYTLFNLVVVTPLSLYFALIFTIGTLLVNVLGYSKDAHYSSFSILSCFALIGMYLVAFAGSIVSIFIGLELMSIPTIFAILLSRKIAIEASVKLFILATIAIALFAFGMVLVYGATGSILLSNPQTVGTLMLIALALLIAALGFETALFPFNLWVPDVYQGSTTYVTAMLGGINKKVGFLALVEILFMLFIAYKSTFIPILYIVAVLTMFYGNLAALAQKNVKRLLAYSSIAQAGYILIGLVVATQYSLGASFFQIFAHMLMFIGAMGVVLFMESKNRHEINDYIGLHKESSIAAFCLAIILISFIGIPLTAGFIGKFLLFSSAVYGGLLPLAILGVINSMISVYYYFKIIAAMYTNRSEPVHIKMHGNVLFVVLICTLLILIIGIYPQLLIELTTSAAQFLS